MTDLACMTFVYLSAITEQLLEEKRQLSALAAEIESTERRISLLQQLLELEPK